MVDVLISNETHVVVSDDESNNTDIENHVFSVEDDIGNDIADTGDINNNYIFEIGTGKDNVTSDALPFMDDKISEENEIDSESTGNSESKKPGEKYDMVEIENPSQTFRESGWSPLVIGSVSGISNERNTNFAARMLNIKSVQDWETEDDWRPSGSLGFSRRE